MGRRWHICTVVAGRKALVVSCTWAKLFGTLVALGAIVGGTAVSDLGPETSLVESAHFSPQIHTSLVDALPCVSPLPPSLPR